MKISSNSMAWIGTGILSLIVGFVINSGALCSASCTGKGTIFIYVAALAVILGLALSFVKKGKK